MTTATAFTKQTGFVNVTTGKSYGGNTLSNQVAPSDLMDGDGDLVGMEAADFGYVPVSRYAVHDDTNTIFAEIDGMERVVLTSQDDVKALVFGPRKPSTDGESQ